MKRSVKASGHPMQTTRSSPCSSSMVCSGSGESSTASTATIDRSSIHWGSSPSRSVRPMPSRSLVSTNSVSISSAVAPAPRRIHPSATSWTRDVGSMSSESAASASDAHSFPCGKRFVIASFNVIIGSPSRPRRCSRVLLLSVLSGDATRRLLRGSGSRWTSGNDLFGSSSNQTDPRNLATLARSSSSVDGPASALATASAARGLNMAS